MKEVPNKKKRIYIGVDLDEEEAEHLAELLSVGVEKLKKEPPKLEMEDKKYLIRPGVLVVEEQKDVGGKLVQEGKIIPGDKKFKMVIV
jgi:hypothetical protein